MKHLLKGGDQLLQVVFVEQRCDVDAQANQCGDQTYTDQLQPGVDGEKALHNQSHSAQDHHGQNIAANDGVKGSKFEVQTFGTVNRKEGQQPHHIVEGTHGSDVDDFGFLCMNKGKTDKDRENTGGTEANQRNGGNLDLIPDSEDVVKRFQRKREDQVEK